MPAFAVGKTFCYFGGWVASENLPSTYRSILVKSLVPAANKAISERKKALQALKKELDGYKSVKGQINVAAVQQENVTFRKQNEQYKVILRELGFLHSPEKKSIYDMMNNR